MIGKNKLTNCFNQLSPAARSTKRVLHPAKYRREAALGQVGGRTRAPRAVGRGAAPALCSCAAEVLRKCTEHPSPVPHVMGKGAEEMCLNKMLMQLLLLSNCSPLAGNAPQHPSPMGGCPWAALLSVLKASEQGGTPSVMPVPPPSQCSAPSSIRWLSPLLAELLSLLGSFRSHLQTSQLSQ